MKNSLLFITIAFIFCSAFTTPEKVIKKADKVISKFYDSDDYTKEAITISEILNNETRADFNENNFFKITKNDQFLGYGYIGNAPSKTATFDYLVLFDEDFIITKSKVLIYREEYGGEISSKRWLRQFDGVTPQSSKLVYNDDIVPISGATISVQSMTLAMNNLLKSLRILQEKQAI